MEIINKNAYYRFLYRGETCLGVFTQSLDDPKSDRVQLLDEVSVDEDMSAAGSFYVRGIKKLAITESIILVSKSIDKECVFVVHKHWFVQGNFGPFIDGMEDIYYTESIDKFAFHPGNFISCRESCHKKQVLAFTFLEYVDIMNNVNVNRFQIYNGFQQALRNCGNSTNSSFNIENVCVDFIQYLDKSLGQFGLIEKDKSKAISIQMDNYYVRREIPMNCYILQSPNVEAVIKYFGSNFYYCPIVNSAYDFGFDNEVYAYIPIHSAQILFEWDCQSRRYNNSTSH